MLKADLIVMSQQGTESKGSSSKVIATLPLAQTPAQATDRKKEEPNLHFLEKNRVEEKSHVECRNKGQK